jgi:hypothetical protein
MRQLRLKRPSGCAPLNVCGGGLIQMSMKLSPLPLVNKTLSM